LKINIYCQLNQCRSVLTKIYLIIAVCLLLAGCGAKGALFLPDKKNDEVITTKQEVISKKSEKNINQTESSQAKPEESLEQPSL